jgi:hypothetical protein
MNEHTLRIVCIEITTPNKKQIDHIWTNALTQLCHAGSTQIFWTDHNLIHYFAFK